MDNLGKALYMAVSVLLFIVALTASVFLYNSIISNANVALMVSDMGDRAESVSSVSYDHTRKILRSEIISSIMQIDTLEINKIAVKNNNSTISYEPYKKNGEVIRGYMVTSKSGKAQDISNYKSFDTDIALGKYSVKYNFNTKTLEYNYIGGV